MQILYLFAISPGCDDRVFALAIHVVAVCVFEFEILDREILSKPIENYTESFILQDIPISLGDSRANRPNVREPKKLPCNCNHRFFIFITKK